MKTFFYNKALLFIILMMLVEVVNAQTRSFTFTNNATKEGFSTISSTASSIRVKHALKQMALEAVTDNGYSGEQIEISGIFLPADEGKPNLPTNSRFIAIPNGATVNYSINSSQFQIINNVDLMAAAPIKAGGDDTPATYEKDSSVYGVNAFYPENPVVISEVRNLRGVQTVILSITPYQYNPVTKVLKVYHDLDISLSFVGGNGHFGEDRLRSPYFDPILQQSLMNYNQLPAIDYESRMRGWVSNRPTGCEYLIVIPNNENFRPYAQQLANYRIKQGILTEVKSLSDMGCTTTSQMKNYFHSAYNNWEIPPVAVLLLGDYSTNMSSGIPAETISHPSPYVNSCITDNGYADANGDNLPDICFSRLVAANPNEAQMMVNKTLDYEYYHPNMAASTYQQPITALGWQTERWFQICSEVIGGYWRNQGKTPVRINAIYDGTPGNTWSTAQNTSFVTNYFGPNGRGYIPSTPNELGGWTGGTAQQVVNAVNNGAFILQHRDHGYETGWGEPNFSVNNVSEMTNTDKLTFVMTINCKTGKFNYNGNCLVEAFMRRIYNNKGAGAVGCIGPTETSYSFVNDTYVWGMYDLFDPNFMPDYGPYANYNGNWMPAFGNVAGKFFLAGSSWPSNPNEKEITNKIFTAHCDAFLRLYTTVPQTMIVEHPSRICMDGGNIVVKAPVGARIALSKGNEILAVAYANGDYQEILFQPQTPNDVIDLVVTKQDCLCYEAQITHLNVPLTGSSVIEEQAICEDYLYSLEVTSTETEIFTFDWSCSSNLTIVSTDDNKAYVRANGTGSGYVQVTVLYQGIELCQYVKDVTISQQYNTITTANITTNTTWAANNYYLNRDVFVEPGATLTVTGTVYCSEQACIKVKPDGKLVVNGGHLLSLCDGEQWEGIQVWGNKNKHQLKENGHYWQGIAELKNNAIIENAKIAINLWNPTAADSTNTSGGIVFASNTRFINNAMAVNFEPYENKFQHPQHPEQTVVRDNVSYFTDCLFEVNSDYVGPNIFFTHANLHRVRGVKFKACDFRLEDNPFNHQWPIGIHGYNAGFSVDGNYNYYSNGTVGIRKRSTFDNFLKAVVSTNDGFVGGRTFTVKATDFTNNHYGVFAHYSGYGTVLNSNFEVGQHRYGCPAGIYAELTPQFTIEQDTFTMAEVHPEEYYGIIIKNSKSVNQVYGNVFKNLYCGNVAVDVNGSSYLEGLTYRCNENYDNKCDFFISSENSYTQGTNGIQQNQGMAGETANNTFSQPSSGNNPRHIYNNGDYSINYYYNSSQNNATPMFIYNVTRIDTIDTIGCPIHYAFSGISSDTVKPVIPQYERQLLENEYYNAYSIYNTLKSVYDNRIDGGNTTGTIANIENAQPGDMWTLRAQLLGLSPYLSGGVLRTAIDKDDVFSTSVLFEILAANPEELKKNSIINYLQDKEHPMPGYMIELLRQIADGATARSVIESQMAKYKHAYTLAAGDIVRSLLNDTEVNLTELRFWLGNMYDINADHDIISIYMEEGNFTDAMALANMLPSLYGLTGNDLLDHYDYIRLLTLCQALKQEGRTTFQLTPTEKELVEDVVDNGYGTAAIMAQSIMESVYGINEFTCPQVDFSKGDRGMTFSYSNEDLSKAMGLTCSTSPNPATTWVNVEFTLPSDADRATLIVSNALGVKIAEYELIGNTGQKVLDLRDLANGVYTCTLICGKYQCTNKLVITK